MTTYVLANLKGGTAKTTSAAYLLHVLHQLSGQLPLGVDADPSTSLLRWSVLTNWQIPVIGLPVKNIHARLPGIDGAHRDKVIDTPPLEEQGSIVYGALKAADVVVVPISPTSMELDRVTPVLHAVEEVSEVMVTPPRVVILLNRVHPTANSTKNARLTFQDAGLEVLPTGIPRLERYANAFGLPVELTTADPYLLAGQDLGMAA
jgi:chromosome partitioning protein